MFIEQVEKGSSSLSYLCYFIGADQAIMTQLKLYFDLMSQPARTVYLFCKLNKIQFTACPVALRKMEQKKPEYLANVNPFGMVPAIDHAGFVLTESVAIVQYLSREFRTEDGWYPADSQSRARVDEYLSWHQFNTRYRCSAYFITRALMPFMTGQPVNESDLKKCDANLTETLDQIESVWLGKRPFIAGENISIADLFAVCELEQPMTAHCDVMAGRTNIPKWYESVKQLCSPHYEETHQVCREMKKKLASKL